MALRVIADPATAACSGCHGRCCYEHHVPISGHDLWRLTRGLGVPWTALVEVHQERVPFGDGFRLDRGPLYHFFVLRKRDVGACQFLLELPGEYRRCGVHGLRPSPCRSYPLLPTRDGAAIGGHTICPDPRRALYESAASQLRSLLDEEIGERMIYSRLLARWDLAAMCVPTDRPLSVDLFVEFAGAICEAIEPLRTPERGAWQLRAYDLIDRFPLPDFGPSASATRSAHRP